MSGKRFGGEFSPGGPSQEERPRPKGASALKSPPNRFAGRAPRRGTGGAKLIYAAAAPLALAALFDILSGNAIAAAIELAAFATLMFCAWMTVEGVRAAQAFEARTVARPPAIPRKILGTLSATLGVALGAVGGWGLDIWQAIVMGGLAGGAHLIAFGPDPMRSKGLETGSDFDRERVATAIDKAEALVSSLLAEARRIGDRRLEGRVEALAAAARRVFRAVEEDPRDLPRARKFMGLYLSGARDATAKFADIYSRSRDAAARADYEALLDDLETSFNAHRERLLIEDRSDLDIEIEVLRDRLKHEGLSPATEE